MAAIVAFTFLAGERAQGDIPGAEPAPFLLENAKGGAWPFSMPPCEVATVDAAFSASQWGLALYGERQVAAVISPEHEKRPAPCAFLGIIAAPGTVRTVEAPQ